MAQPNYSGEKRRRELEKQRKKAEKKQRKLDHAVSPETPATSTEERKDEPTPDQG